MFREVPTERLVRTYVSEGFLEKEENRAVLKDIPYEVMTDKVFTTVSDTQTPQGVLCVVRQKEYTLDEMLKKEREEILNATVEDIRALAPITKAVLETGAVCVVGNEDKIKADRELFKEIKPLFE